MEEQERAQLSSLGGIVAGTLLVVEGQIQCSSVHVKKCGLVL